MHLLIAGLVLILSAPVIANTQTEIVPLETEVAEEEKPPKEPVNRLTWRDNPKNCDLKTEWIRADNFGCIPIPSPSETPSTPQASDNCNREKWLEAVGIPQNEWPYVDQIINGEGGWCGVTLWNTGGSGAYGICQSLPADKMATAGADYMTNGLTQLKWCQSYMLGRYGTWAYAAEWKACTGYCVNTFNPAYSSDKNHSWW